MSQPQLTPFEQAVQSGKFSGGRIPLPAKPPYAKAAQEPVTDQVQFARETTPSAVIAPKVQVSPFSQDQKDYVNKAMQPDAPPADEPAAPAAEEPVKSAEPHYCRNCGFDQGQDPTEVTEEDKREFMRAVLGGKPFRKTYSLFDGALVLTFRTRSTKVDRMCVDQCTREVRDGRIDPTNITLANGHYSHRLRRLHLTASLEICSTQWADPLPRMDSPEALATWPEVRSDDPKSPVKDNVIAVAHDAIFDGWEDTLFAVVFAQYGEFEQLVLRCLQSAAAAGFWKTQAGGHGLQ